MKAEDFSFVSGWIEHGLERLEELVTRLGYEFLYHFRPTFIRLQVRKRHKIMEVTLAVDQIQSIQQLPNGEAKIYVEGRDPVTTKDLYTDLVNRILGRAVIV